MLIAYSEEIKNTKSNKIFSIFVFHLVNATLKVDQNNSSKLSSLQKTHINLQDIPQKITLD